MRGRVNFPINQGAVNQGISTVSKNPSSSKVTNSAALALIAREFFLKKSHSSQIDARFDSPIVSSEAFRYPPELSGRMGDYGDAMMRNQNAAVQARTKAQNRANVMQLKLVGSHTYP